MLTAGACNGDSPTKIDGLDGSRFQANRDLAHANRLSAA